ncbi:hypothetical protein LEP1GSC073_4355 [Leptospira noguchii str. Cascata]|nr:hypothetical protein LEP1GSC072_2644 [Leptospira noguchii str. Bonito]EMS88296.1 hypothetical protein LEP1GSC073_4355 [Leptospira noguchii str. Cascata]
MEHIVFVNFNLKQNHVFEGDYKLEHGRWQQERSFVQVF